MTIKIIIHSKSCAFLFTIIIDEAFPSLNIKNNFEERIIEKDCEYAVPVGYQIVYSSEDSRYAVKVLEYDNRYLITDLIDLKIKARFADITKPATFKDSCSAKGYLKYFIKKSNPMINYK